MSLSFSSDRQRVRRSNDTGHHFDLDKTCCSVTKDNGAPLLIQLGVLANIMTRIGICIVVIILKSLSSFTRMLQVSLRLTYILPFMLFHWEMMEYYMNHYHSYYSTIASVANSNTMMRNIFRHINEKGVKTCVLLFLFFSFRAFNKLFILRWMDGEEYLLAKKTPNSIWQAYIWTMNIWYLGVVYNHMVESTE